MRQVAESKEMGRYQNHAFHSRRTTAVTGMGTANSSGDLCLSG